MEIPMTRTSRRALVGVAIAAAAVACSEGTAPDASLADATTISTALTTTLLGSAATSTSFTAGDSAWAPSGDHGPGGRGGRHGHGGFGDSTHGLRGGDLMGGGLGGDFHGDGEIGRGFGHGPFGGSALPSSCTFAAATGRVTCPTESHDGLTISRSAAYATAAGVAQSTPDSTTNSVNLRVTVAGTAVHPDGDTSTVSHASDRTVTGLAAGSSARTVNGTAAGTETTVGTSMTKGRFVAIRTMGDTTRGVVTPVVSGRPTYPTAGTVIRAMSASIAYAGAAATTTARREVITYDGSATATVVITQDGATKSCTLPAAPFRFARSLSPPSVVSSSVHSESSAAERRFRRPTAGGQTA
jgi:hypothetical protein